jgi:hypothetical protein
VQEAKSAGESPKPEVRSGKSEAEGVKPAASGPLPKPESKP